MMQNDSAKCQSDPTLTGTCTNYTKKWFYSRSYRECIMFHYGGCGQTKNLFDSEEHCESLCLGLGDYKHRVAPLEKCDDVPTETGPCQGEFEMWRFDNVNRQCESFIYGGCQATNNFFETGMHCVLNCLKHHEF
ncbi:WAP, Kazal, immunoglobulin, Kunitz and NTR domain-containing protein 2-like [Drosophila guanche]|uniref:WAP, Kazal, immunoglobulin, Kunitz and NTR domain-containing protein 2-like n=1 Tax=Drosophila guanche TaxID=7266 RepID=UPI001470EEDD|nr:WAP, Kazal, immunoglobulin, Kunitz and NTR domain-containing protein 2-like [Drosophila guanche]